MAGETCVRVDGCVYAGGMRLYCLKLKLPCRGVVAIVGGNGSGKTTLMRSIVGLITAVEGYVWSARPHIYMPEEHFAPFPARVKDWFWFNGVNLEEVIAAGFPAELLGRQMKKLSHGWRRFAELLAVLLQDAKVYVLDEPFSGMDPGRVAASIRLLEERARNSLVIVSGHDSSQLDGVASQVVEIVDGGVRVVGGS